MDFTDYVEMSVHDIRQTGKTLAQHFVAMGKYCELDGLLEEYRENCTTAWTSTRSIVVFQDGSVIKVERGAVSIVSVD